MDKWKIRKIKRYSKGIETILLNMGGGGLLLQLQQQVYVIVHR